MELNELTKKLKEVAQRMLDDDKDVYTIYENLEAEHEEGNYKFSFIAKKKEGSLASIPMGRDFFRDEIKGMASPELLKKPPRFTLEPIYDEMITNQLAILIDNWSETMPQGYLEAIGSTIDLPNDESLISAKIKPDEEFSLKIESTKIRVED